MKTASLPFLFGFCGTAVGFFAYYMWLGVTVPEPVESHSIRLPPGPMIVTNDPHACTLVRLTYPAKIILTVAR
jgi:hypothetical protein